MAVIVAVDGGGSRCRLAAFDESGMPLARVIVDGHASLSRGAEEAWKNIDSGLVQLRRQLHRSPGWLPDRLMMGLAGSLQETRRRVFLAQLPEALAHTLVTDGHAQLLGASAGKPGICLAIGTGSVLHWLDEKGQSGMVGGWGFPVGDEGSGAWLGMRLVQLYLWHVDGRHHSGSLIEALTARLGTRVSEIQQWSTQTQSGVLAQLAPLVFEHAANGDPLALSLLDDGVAHALALLELAPDQLPVHVVGGIGERMQDRLGAYIGDRLHPARGDALQGLWQLWADSCGEAP
ncbi:BadF/BadG/BcrA/BcrD ATPase family protein [Granulosicoccus sp. 3-233]|uniref:BadF/BadG/BcrA/BcrD ATPase family protein n=1 Tax=Granulosicoccus sp. 3-233 TaxID=3417969 RepID=UPI003D35780F